MARKEKNIHYIYKTTCNVTGKWYIGMHSTLNEEDGYMGSGLVLRRSIRKYGVDNHTKEILEYCESREALVLRETEIVTKELISDGLCMNLKEGGQGGFRDEEHMMKCSKAGAKKHSERMKTDNDYYLKVRDYLSKGSKNYHKSGKHKYGTFKDKKHSEESKKLISEVMKGKGSGEANSQFGTCWINNGVENKKIKKDDLTEYLDNHWVKGRIKK